MFGSTLCSVLYWDFFDRSSEVSAIEIKVAIKAIFFYAYIFGFLTFF